MALPVIMAPTRPFRAFGIEHTKTGVWIEDSTGLVIDSCRFRNTLADGCNLNIGIQNTTVTNCTARGTGDDCFPHLARDIRAAEIYARQQRVHALHGHAALHGQWRRDLWRRKQQNHRLSVSGYSLRLWRAHQFIL